MEENKQNLGELLSDSRQSLKMTLQSASDQVGISKSYMHDLENNVSEPSLYISFKLSLLYDINIHDMAMASLHGKLAE